MEVAVVTGVMAAAAAEGTTGATEAALPGMAALV